MSRAAVKSFDRRNVSCKNARAVQFSGGGEKCPVTPKSAQLVSNVSWWSSKNGVTIVHTRHNKDIVERLDGIRV